MKTTQSKSLLPDSYGHTKPPEGARGSAPSHSHPWFSRASLSSPLLCDGCESWVVLLAPKDPIIQWRSLHVHGIVADLHFHVMISLFPTGLLTACRGCNLYLSVTCSHPRESRCRTGLHFQFHLLFRSSRRSKIRNPNDESHSLHIPIRSPT